MLGTHFETNRAGDIPCAGSLALCAPWARWCAVPVWGRRAAVCSAVWAAVHR